MSTDNGHVDGANGEHGLSWAYKHPEKMIDWAWRALHLSTIAAKKTVARLLRQAGGEELFHLLLGRQPSRHHGSDALSGRL